jgi:hypothetical protein
MWLKVKNISNMIYRIFIALILVLFTVLVFITIGNNELNQNTQLVTFISLMMVLISIPGIINQFADEFNPKKKTYKLSCRCPKCTYLLEMDMKEQ